MKIAPWFLTLAVLIAAAPAAHAEDESAKPPSITYGGSRSSKTWIGMPGRSRVGVDEGVLWRGVKVYLSLTWDLVGVDAKTGKTLYVQHVGAFWNALTFKEVTPKGGKQGWALELAPGPRAREGKDRRQYHHLRTGKKLEVPGVEHGPSGAPFQPRANWMGKTSRIAEPFFVLVSTPENWLALQQRMFGGVDPKRVGPVDFRREVVFVMSSGNGWNCNGHDVVEGYEDAHRILLRTDRVSFQTIGGGMRARAWGIFVLPRRPAKGYVVERDVQGLIGGPRIWKRTFAVKKLGPPESELAKLPPSTDKPHGGWEGQDDLPPRPPPVRPPKKDR